MKLRHVYESSPQVMNVKSQYVDTGYLVKL